MKVAISQRIDLYPNRFEIRDSLDQNLNFFSYNAGFLPIPVPNVGESLYKDKIKSKSFIEDWIKEQDIKGIILSGGNDINQFPNRDFTEISLLNYACVNNIPILGICRGMQLISKKFGVEPKSISGHVNVRHNLSGNFSGEVNSFHNYGIDRCPENFNCIAVSNKNDIEAITHRTKNIEGWMWHPEREKKFRKEDIDRLKFLFLKK